MYTFLLRVYFVRYLQVGNKYYKDIGLEDVDKGGENNKEAWGILDGPADLLGRKTDKVIQH